jgi:hypothetical protein
MDDAHNQLGPALPADTSFKGCWEQLVRDRGLPADPEALIPPTTVAQARRDALEVFSWGLRHQTMMRRRLDHLLPENSSPSPGGKRRRAR